jgi:hypothetical protein
LSSRLLSKNFKIKIYRTIILPVVLYGCETWSLTLREELGLRVFDVDGRIILRWIFRKLDGVLGTGWSWLRIGTGGGHLWIRQGTFEFHKCGEFLD